MRAKITQYELEAIEATRREKSALTAKLRDVEAALAQRERDLMEKLTSGARIEQGKLGATVEQKTVCNPSYKDELVAHFEQSHGLDGKLVEEQVRKRWTTQKDVIVITHSVGSIEFHKIH